MFAISVRAFAAGPPVVEPVMQDGKPVTAEQNGKTYPVFRFAANQKFVASIDHVFESSFAGEMLKLFSLSRQIASERNRRTGVPDDPEFANPIYLLLSQEQGGYARRDFFLESSEGERIFISADYIDLIVDDDSVASGDFEEIFSHELGHSILRNLVGELQGPRSNKMHQSMTLTDYRTAFDEGFAEHFQPLVRQNSTNVLLQRQQRGVVAPSLSQEFLSQRDQVLRNYGPGMNTFIHGRFVPTCASVAECYIVEETSTSFDPAEMRTGQQMLSSEGFVATVFLQLVSEEATPVCAHDCSTLEQKYKRLFESLAAIGANANQSPLLQMLEVYRVKFPDQAPPALADFVLLTRGATISVEALHAAEALDLASAHADIAGFRTQLHALRDLLKQATADVVAGKIKLDAAVGPELWVRNDAFTHSSLWSEGEETPLRINLNTASAEEIATLPQFPKETAQTIVRERKHRAFFSSIEDVISAAKLTPAQADVLKNALRSQASAKPDPVQ